MFLLPFPMPEHLTVWTNTADGNNHSVVVAEGKLTLTVIKPDKTQWSETKDTISSPGEWQTAFEGLGSKWNQDAENKRGNRYQAIRTASTSKEQAIWDVDHEKIDDTRHELRDKLRIILLAQKDQ
jgi:hypothetical protein